ncbi:MAG: DUF2971 domain-containing protein [Candidatus Izemoplasmatales bacterium]|jgi:hypothetical protein|nr:DUF2971 domain-containing protein [Candidatus Izemoplasmatales bacterium]MDY0138675.1 DUF2971 domain-containing protein [Candidatus Izemoplasmatales bacterium]
MKLYKYRGISPNLFKNYIDSLENEYLWLADVLSLNDKSDSVIYYDNEKELEVLENYYLENEIDILLKVLEKLISIPGIIDAIKKIPKNQIAEIIKLHKSGDQNQISDYLSFQGESQEKISEYLNVQNNAMEFLKSKENEALSVLQPILDFNNNVRSRLKIFSMSDSYDIASQWGTYADGNKGFCLEYDFSKIPDERIIKSLKQVEYVENREALSYKDFFLNALFSHDSKKEMINIFEKQLITKEMSWSSEREWRIILVDIENKYFINVVSAIYIDESIEHTDEAKQLIEIARHKNWKCFIRRLDSNMIKYNYEEKNFKKEI